MSAMASVNWRRWSWAAGAILSASLAGCIREPAPVPAPVGPDASAEVAASRPKPPAPLEAVVAAVDGKVERLREGGWSSLRVGDTVRTLDAIRTGPKSRTDLEIDSSSRLSVAEETQLDVAALTGEVHRFNLKKGRIAAAYQPSATRLLRIEGGRGEVAESSGGRFSVLAGEKEFAVATETGTVNLRAAGIAVAVAENQMSKAVAGAAPAAPAPLPAELLLKVALAARRPPGSCAVEGKADPGAVVRVAGEAVEVGPDGRFSASLRGHPAGRIKVISSDALGRIREKEILCEAMPAAGPPPSVDEVNIDWRQ